MNQSTENFIGLVLGSAPLTVIACDAIVGSRFLSDPERWIGGAGAVLCVAIALWSDKMRSIRTRNRALWRERAAKPCGCWRNPTGNVVFVEADRVYRCALCGMRWTASAWREVELGYLIPQETERRP